MPRIGIEGRAREFILERASGGGERSPYFGSPDFNYFKTEHVPHETALRFYAYHRSGEAFAFVAGAIFGLAAATVVAAGLNLLSLSLTIRPITVVITGVGLCLLVGFCFAAVAMYGSQTVKIGILSTALLLLYELALLAKHLL